MIKPGVNNKFKYSLSGNIDKSSSMIYIEIMCKEVVVINSIRIDCENQDS